MRLLLLTLILSLSTACAYKNPRDAKLGDSLMAYKRMIRGNSFDQVALFYTEKPTPLTSEQRKALSDIRITGYEVLVANAEDNGNKISQVVKIRFIDETTQKESIITDQQVWLWNDLSKRWYLDSELPEFIAE